MPSITAAYARKPFHIEFRDVTLPAPGHTDVLIDVLACGICGFDMETCECLADTPRPIGHEISGIVREIGPGVTHVKPGDQVVLESGTFCCDCDTCRNGRVDLCNRGPGFWSGPSMGFADALLTPARAVVPAPDIDPISAALAEPCGVAIDMIKVAEIGLTDRVLLVGSGPIGLMALAIARRLTSGPIVVANRSTGKFDTARRLGADAVISTNTDSLADSGKPYGGFDKVLITAPPQVIADCITAAAYGAYIVFIGSNFRDGGTIPLDTHALHFGKKQLRPSFASPALYLPEALQLLRTGAVPPEAIISHRFPLSQLPEAMRVVREERDTAKKVMVIPDSKFTD